MNRMHLVLLTAGTALALALGTSFAAPPKQKSKEIDHSEHNQGLQACAKACADCQLACDTCATHCAHKVHAGEGEHIKTLMSCQDCADACSAAAHIAARGGPFATTICQACADICGGCAKNCEAFPDDEHMKKCAEECRKCEKACREMAKHGEHAKPAKPAK